MRLDQVRGLAGCGFLLFPFGKNPTASEGAASGSRQWINNSDSNAPRQPFNDESVQINLKLWQWFSAIGRAR
jgi:hypothetical protein